MDRSDVIKLIARTFTKDSNGVQQASESAREVFCQVDSIQRNEFFEAGRNGLNPEYKFTLFFGDYNGEKVVEYAGNRYAVYRQYHGRTDTIELYVQREGGTNAAEGGGTNAAEGGGTNAAEGGDNG